MKFHGEEPSIEDMEINWVGKNRRNPKVTIADYGVILNKIAYEVMGKPSHATLGIDKEQGVVGIRKVNANQKLRKWPKKARIFELNPRKGRVRFNCTPFTNTIYTLLQQPDKPTLNFIPDYYDDYEMLIIDLDRDLIQEDE